MKRRRAFGATELLIATSLLAFGVASACGGGSGSSSPANGGGGAGGTATGGQNQGGASGKGGGSAGKGGKGGTGTTGGDENTAGGAPPDAGPVTGGDSGAGGVADGPPVDTSLKQPVYPAVKFPPENPDADAKDMLGKILFWDEQVGADGTQACGTCHRTGPGGGSDPRSVSPSSRSPGDDGILGTADDVHGSQGIRLCTGGDGAPVVYGSSPIYGTNHQVTTRKAPTYLDAMFAADIFWDGRATTKFTDPVSNLVAIQVGGGLESQSVGPPMNPAEMACTGRTWASLLNYLGTVTPLNLAKEVPPDMKSAITAAHGHYSELFNAAFGSAEITVSHFAFAIATHERHLTSNQTPWDLYNQFLNDPKTGDRNALTPAQVHGFDLFMNKAACGSCHIPPFFTDFQFHNLGFVSVAVDKGRAALAGHTADPPGQVKTANLRNVGLRETQGLFHYGHGPGASLDTVLAAYNNPPNLQDPTLNDAAGSAVKPLNLTGDEIADIIDFLRNGLTDPRVQNEQFPFDKPTLSTE
jgi:cytochrome c peroxidase